jgi:Ca2+-binding EF-hand superfamily protein
MVDKLSKEELEEYREAFAYFDRDRDGRLTAQEVVQVIRAVGQAPSEKQAGAIIAEIGANSKLDFNEFIVTAMKRPVPSGSVDEILEAFKVFDKDGAGFLPSSELKHTMTHLGEKFPDIEAEYMLMEAGVDADGKVNYEQFVRDMMQWK